MKSIKQILTDYLTKNGFDGFYSDIGGFIIDEDGYLHDNCGCELANLCSCNCYLDFPHLDCHPGYKDYYNCGNKSHWRMRSKKSKEEDEKQECTFCYNGRLAEERANK